MNKLIDLLSGMTQLHKKVSGDIQNLSGQISGYSSVQSLLFKIPQVHTNNLTGFFHFRIEFSDSDNFLTIKTLDTNNSNTYISTNNTINGLKYFTGKIMSGFPTSGVPEIFSNELIKVDKDLISGNYYRFQWLYGDDTFENLISGRFGYGQINGTINVFDINVPEEQP